MSNYLSRALSTPTPQTEPLSSAQTPNSAGGYSYQVDDFQRLERFLILGTEGGSYYASERKLTLENVDCIKRCLARDGTATVAAIVRVSLGGLAPKNDPAILALAVALKQGDLDARRAARAAVPSVCRTGTHLLHFAEFVENLGGWGTLTQGAFQDWFAAKSADSLAYQVVKYPQRDGWSMKDILRKAHVGKVITDKERQAILRHVVDRDNLGARTVTRGQGAGSKTARYPTLESVPFPTVLDGAIAIRSAPSAKAAANLIRDFNLPREAVPTDFLNDLDVWQALLDVGMPLGAMVRNLGKMTSIGLVAPLSDAARTVVDALGNVEALRRSRLHPLSILVANRTYASGHGFKGSLSWNPVTPVRDALEAAFYAAFQAVQPTGKRWMLGLDVSGSMSEGSVCGSPLTPREASVAMAMVTAATEKQHHFFAFGQTAIPFDASPKERLLDVCNRTARLPWSGTDCSLPMRYALEKNIQVDAFCVYTDSETYAGPIHPSEALKQYRQKMGIDAKLIVVGMVSNGFTIADPTDPGMLDVVGFSTAVPQAMAAFVGGSSGSAAEVDED